MAAPRPLEVLDWNGPTSDFPAIGKDLAATQESLHTTQNSLSDCFNEVRVLFGAQSRGHKVWERERMPTDFLV